MRQAKKYVVQAEFFLVNISAGSLEDVMSECAERANDCSRIKENVRFFDHSRRIVCMIAQWRTNDKKRNLFEMEQVTKRSSSSLIKSLIYDFRVRHSAQLRLKITAQLKKAIASAAELSVMEDDFSYRPLFANERHELVEAISKSSCAMVFIFRADTLFTEKQTILFRMI